MKLGFIVSQISFGGGERILQTLIDEFERRGHKIVLYTYNTEWSKIKNLKHELHVLSYSPIGFIDKIKSILELKKIFAKSRPDCVIVFPLALAEVVAIAGKLSSIPVISSERVDPIYLPTSKIHRVLKKVTYNLCAGIVFQTSEVQNFFSSKIQKKSIVIPNPIMDELPEVSDCRNKEIVAVGRLSSEKNFELLIRSFADLCDTDYCLSIYGDGPDKIKLNHLVADLHLQNKIFFKGNVSKVVEHIKNADIFVLSSCHEGMPNALIEAMAMGLACIATDVSSGGCKSLITTGYNGILIPVGDVEALSTALKRMIDDPIYKVNLQKNAIQIRRTNSKDIIIPQWVDYIYRIVNS